MAELITPNPISGLPPQLFEGQRLDQPTFHARYEATPETFRAELIGGVVHIMSPTSDDHSDPETLLLWWLREFQFASPGTAARGELTVILGPQSEPQPDGCLRILESHGGRSWKEGRYIHGAPELMVEVALSTVRRDLYEKKADYEAAGVQEYLVVLPEERRVTWLALNAGQTIEPDGEGILKSLAFPGLWLDAESLLDGDDAGVRDVLHRGISSPEHVEWAAELAGR